jgi:hypothetical protein
MWFKHFEANGGKRNSKKQEKPMWWKNGKIKILDVLLGNPFCNTELTQRKEGGWWGCRCGPGHCDGVLGIVVSIHIGHAGRLHVQASRVHDDGGLRVTVPVQSRGCRCSPWWVMGLGKVE